MGIDVLQEQFQKDRNSAENMDDDYSMIDEKAALILPEFWTCDIHDKNLLIAVNNNGFDFLTQLSNNKDYGFENIDITPDVAFKRIEEICDFYRDYQQQSRVVKKPKKEANNQASSIEGHINKQESFVEPKRKLAKVQVQRDENGKITQLDRRIINFLQVVLSIPLS